MSKKHSPTMYDYNLAQSLTNYNRPGLPLLVQAVIVIAVIVGFCVIVLALGGGAG